MRANSTHIISCVAYNGGQYKKGASKETISSQHLKEGTPITGNMAAVANNWACRDTTKAGCQPWQQSIKATHSYAILTLWILYL